MTFLSPLALALAVVCIPIILMYILKLRRRPQAVSSTLLWRKALDDVQANAPWQRLRPSVLLFLQLLAALAIVLMLARPAFTSAQTISGDVIIIMDESYTMQTHDVSPSRFAVAQAQARAVAAQRAPGNVVSVIGMGSQPILAVAASDSTTDINKALAGLTPGLSSINLSGALSLAESLARQGESTRAIIFTSRESGIATLPLHLPFPVQIRRIGDLHGKAPNDVAVQGFSALRSPLHVEALARLADLGPKPVTASLQLVSDTGLAFPRTMTLQPGIPKIVFWTKLPSHVRTLHLTVTRHDDVSIDKQAWTVVDSAASGATSTRHVLLVGQKDYFLQTALALDPTVQLSVVSPANYRPSFNAKYDLVVFDGTLPQALPSTPVLILAPPQGTLGPITLGTQVIGGQATASPTLARATPEIASLLQYVDLSDVQVARERTVKVPSWMQPLALAGGSPLLEAGENGPQRLAVATFALQDSNWPLRISFPIMMQNLVRFLVPGLQLSSTNVSVGDAVNFSPAGGVREIDVTRTGGGTVARIKAPFSPFAATDQPGLYTATAIGGHRPVSSTFAVNFFPAQTTPAKGPQVVTIGHLPKGKSTVHHLAIPNSVAWMVALGALGVLTTEWWFAFRR